MCISRGRGHGRNSYRNRIAAQAVAEHRYRQRHRPAEAVAAAEAEAVAVAETEVISATKSVPENLSLIRSNRLLVLALRLIRNREGLNNKNGGPFNRSPLLISGVLFSRGRTAFSRLDGNYK